MKVCCKKYIVPFFLVFILVGLLASCKKEESKAPEKAHRALKKISAETVTAQRVSVPLLHSFPGLTRAKINVNIGAKIPGYIKAVFVEEGDRVVAGQTLIQIDEADITAKIKALEASRQAVLRQKKAVQSRLAYALSNFSRIKRLFEMESATQEELDRATSEVEALKAQIKAVEAEAEAVKAQIKEVKNQLNYLRIASPVNGWVIKRFVDPGTLANPGMVLLAIDSAEAGTWFEAMIDEKLLGKVREGQIAKVEIPAAALDVEAPIAKVIPQVDPSAHAFKIKVDLGNSSLKSGLFGTVLLSTGEKKIVLLPLNAIIERGGIQGVYAVGPDKIIHWRVIKKGLLWKRTASGFEPASKDGEGQLFAEIIAGVAEGDVIVASNLDKVQEGASLE